MDSVAGRNYKSIEEIKVLVMFAEKETTFLISLSAEWYGESIMA